jgi:hypothetical protein
LMCYGDWIRRGGKHHFQCLLYFVNMLIYLVNMYHLAYFDYVTVAEPSCEES